MLDPSLKQTASNPLIGTFSGTRDMAHLVLARCANIDHPHALGDKLLHSGIIDVLCRSALSG